jgi:oxalate---CoA ligase
VDRIERDDDFFELGGHSLLAVKLFARMERAFGLRLPVSTLFRSPTLAALADEIDQAARLSQSETRALVPLQPLGTRPPIFFIHNIWGDLLEYRPLTMRLGTDQPVFGFEAPVAKDGASEVPTMEEIAQSYIEELRRFQPEGPYLLCGYCGAGALALEMARQLRAGGAPVPMLAIIDGASPGHGTPRSAVGRLMLAMKRFRKQVARNLRLLPGLSPVDVPEFMRDRAYKILVRAFGMPAYRLSVRLRRPLLPELRQRHGVLSYASRAYQPGRYDGLITLIRSRPYGTPTLGWERLADGGVDVRWVAGYHLSMMREPFVGQLADQLRACVDEALAQSRG